MGRIPVITDSHAGAKSDSIIIYNLQRKFYETVFWPAIDAEGGVKELIHCGDLLEKRRHINFTTLQFAKETFFEPAKKRGIKVHWIIGNHDSTMANTLELNGYEAFKEYDNVIPYTTATEVTIENQKVLFMPWICDANFRDSFQKLVDFEGSMLAGHLELYGFEMHKGMPMQHGYITDPFKHVPLVLSGHYHHKSTNGNINYLGSPFELTWSDYDDKRGFHWWDPQKNTIELVENPHNLFYCFTYDDKGKDSSYVKTFLDAIKKNDLEQKIIKIIVKTKTNPVWYEAFSDAMLKLGAFDVMFIDDTAWNTTVDESSIVDGEKSLDSLTMIKWYVKNTPFANDELKQSVHDLMEELYHEACDSTKAGIRQ